MAERTDRAFLLQVRTGQAEPSWAPETGQNHTWEDVTFSGTGSLFNLVAGQGSKEVVNAGLRDMRVCLHLGSCSRQWWVVGKQGICTNKCV